MERDDANGGNIYFANYQSLEETFGKKVGTCFQIFKQFFVN